MRNWFRKFVETHVVAYLLIHGLFAYILGLVSYVVVIFGMDKDDKNMSMHAKFHRDLVFYFVKK